MKKTQVAVFIVFLFVYSAISIGICSPTGTNIAWESSYKGSSLDDESKRQLLLPLNNPEVVPAEQATHLDKKSPVLGLVIDAQPRAYPLSIMQRQHLINDTVNGTPVLINFCPACSSASVFIPVIDKLPNRSLTFQMYGIDNGTYTIYDYQTRSVWSPFSGKTLSGPLHPSKMERIPVDINFWGKWKERHPNTHVAFSSRELMTENIFKIFKNNKVPKELAETIKEDPRLPMYTIVYGIEEVSSGTTIAFLLSFLDVKRASRKYNYGGRTYLIFKTDAYNIYSFLLNEKQAERSYAIDKKNKTIRIYDNHGNSWSEFGENYQSDGEDLQPTNGRITKWFEWASANPKTEIAK